MSEEQTVETVETEQQASRDDLIAAVREAGGTEGVEPPDDAPPPAAATPVEPPAATVDTPDPVAELLRKREEMHRKRLADEGYVAQQRHAAEQERQRIIDEARAEAERLKQQTTASLRQQFQADPTGFLRTLDDDPQNVVDAVVRQGTPEARALAKIQQDAAEARKLAEEGRSAKAELEQFKQEQTREKQQAAYVAARDNFLGTHATTEKAPYLHARFDSDEVFRRCHEQCVAWEKDGLVQGVDFDRDTLVAYLEKQSRERYEKLPAAQAVAPGNAAQAVGAVAKTGNAKQSATGTRTLSAAQGSERRTSPRPLSEMKPEEARAALIEEVAAARRGNPDAVF